MSSADVVMAAVPGVAVRDISPHDLPDALPHTPKGCRADPGTDLTQAACIRERVGWVAEVQGHPAGYAVCAVVRPLIPAPGTGWLARLSDLVRRFLGRRRARPLSIELLDMVVSGLSGSRVKRALLGRLVKEAQRSWSSAPIVVPESNLAAQLFLRGAHYRAVCVLRGHFGDEDGYVMARGAGLTG